MRTLIVDDEAHARARIRQLIAQWPEFEVAEASSGQEAIVRLQNEPFDLVLLDVQMPGVDGFDVVAAVGLDCMPPALVFVTAHDRFALRAFDARAIDYVLKPVSRTRLDAALERARQLVAANHAVGTARSPRRFPVEDGNTALLLETTRIERAVASGNYVEIHVGPRSYLVRATLSDVLEGLGSEFLQVSRSEIVRADRVRGVVRGAHGNARLLLESGASVTWSRRYRSKAHDTSILGASRER